MKVDALDPVAAGTVRNPPIGWFLLALAAIVATSAVGCRNTPSSKSARETEMFLAIDWFGAQTRPMRRVGFATAGKKGGLRKWLRVYPDYEEGAAISAVEANRLLALLATEPFRSVRRATPPGPAFQGYVVLCDSSDGHWFYELGFSASTVRFLKALRRELDAEAGALLDDVIKRFPQ